MLTKLALQMSYEPAPAGEGSLDSMLLDQSSSQPAHKADYTSIFQQFVWMGWSAFGGPAAHIGFFQKVVLWQGSWILLIAPRGFCMLADVLDAMAGATYCVQLRISEHHDERNVATQVLVEKLRWMTPTIFLELLALCQVMPGPTSTQMSFAIGITQQGVTGGLLSGKLHCTVSSQSNCNSSIHLQSTSKTRMNIQLCHLTTST